MIGESRDNDDVRPSHDMEGHASHGDGQPSGASGAHDLMTEAERLAALMDGRLDPARRADVLARLAASDDDLAVLVDAASALAASGESQAEAGDIPAVGAAGVRDARAARDVRVLRFPRRRALTWVALAAAVVAVLLVPYALLHRRATSGSLPDAPALALATGVQLPPGWDANPWGATRGATEPLTAEARSVRIGARLSELALAVRARDSSVARYAACIAALLDEVPAAAPIASMYRDIAQRPGADAGALQPLLERGYAAVQRLPNAELIRLGAWLEAARAAAAAGDTTFFRAAATREITEGARASGALSPDARATLATIMTDAGAAPPDWRRVGTELTTLLGRLGR